MIDKGKTRLSPARFDCVDLELIPSTAEKTTESPSRPGRLILTSKIFPVLIPPQTPKMIFSNVGVGERVLLMWADLGPQPQLFQDSVEQVQKTVGKHHLATHSPVQLCQSYARICHQGQRGER